MESLENIATILLVDDDEALRRFAHRLLMEPGFHVIQACDGAEALDVASEFAGPIDLLLTDVIMPKVNGALLAQRLLQERPSLRVLYMSGYVESSMMLEKHPEATFLQKPFTANALIGAVHQVLAPRGR
jgi:two-component system cell cycle sensor histidine kinase/response regulator CckA